MVVSNFSGPPAPTTVYHNGGSLRSPKTSSFPQHFVSPFALSFEIWNFKKQISKLHFFSSISFKNLSGELVRFETWQRLWKRTRGLGVGPAAGRMGRFALELVDGDSFQCFSWKHWPARLLNNLPHGSEQSLKWEPLQLGSSQLEMIEDIPLLVLLGRLAGIGLRRPFATAPPHPQHGKTICSVFLLFARLLRITLFLTMFIIMVVSQNCFSPCLS